MSERNVELHRRVYRAMNAADDDALIALCHPAIEVHSVFAAIGGAVYHGHEGVRRWQQDLRESWSGEFRVAPEAFFDLGDDTLVVGTLRGRGGQSGVEVDMPVSGVAAWRGGLCVSHKAYPRKEGALAEVGVSTEGLQPLAP